MGSNDVIFVFGLGVSGVGVCRFLKSQKIPFFCTDDNQSKALEFPDEFISDWINFDFKERNISDVVISPGIAIKFPVPHGIVTKALESGINVISDLELLHRFESNKMFIGITGSNGKSTTTSLLGYVLRKLGKKVSIVGNIGKSPFDPDAFGADVYVIEISSYQLESTHFNFDVGVLLNISEDHLIRHGGMDGYIEIKSKILKNKSGIRILGVDDIHTQMLHQTLQSSGDGSCVSISCATDARSGYCIANEKLLHNSEIVCEFPRFDNLLGRHNIQNILAVIAVCRAIGGVDVRDVIESIKSFKALEHRIEFVAEIAGVKFYNDSKATNIDSTQKALEALNDRHIYLIAGGRAKEKGIEVLLPLPCFGCVKEVFLVGECAGEFASKIIEHNSGIPSNSNKRVKYVIAGTMAKAALLAFSAARKCLASRSVVLLSPMCASFDQFRNFEDRGSAFKAAANSIMITEGSTQE